MAVLCSKAFYGWHVFHGVNERLVIWLPSSKAVKTDLVMGQIDFSPDEAMRPERINGIMSALDLDVTKMISATQIDDGALEWKLVIRFPVLREGTARRSGVNTWRGSLPCCQSKTIGTSLDGIVVVMHEPLPDFLLPAAVEALDDGLEAGLMGWGEDRGDAQLQAQTDDTPEGVGKLTCTAKDGVVVKLGIFRESVNAPVSDQRIGGGLGGPRGSDPTGTEACLHADGGQDVDVDPAQQTKVFDEVKAIDVRQPGSDAWEVPAFGRGRPPNSASSIESAAAQKDSADGAEGWNFVKTAFFEGELDCQGTEVTQVALIPELLANSQNQIFDAGRRGGFLASSTSWHIAPSDAVNTQIAGTLHPTLNGSQCHAKFLRHRTLRATPPHSSNDSFTTRFNAVFCSRKAPMKDRDLPSL
jgi:hypothetical protein